MRFENLFHLEEAQKTNMLISGSNACGKTLLACGIASMLHRLNFRVLVFDISGAWRKSSDLPLLSKVYKFDNELMYAEIEGSGIYDMSLLKMSEVKRVVEAETQRIWLKHVNEPYNNKTWIIFEESEVYLKNIRGETAENIYRIIHVGRNQGLRTVLLTTDLALLDASAIRLCNIRFHGSLGIEENSKRKFRAYYGKDWCRVGTHGLETGDFIRLHKRKLDIISVDQFIRHNAPRLNLHFKREQQPEQEKPVKLSLWQKLKALAFPAIFFLSL